MAQLSRQHVLEVESEIKCPADAFYDLLKNKIIDTPILFPEIYKSSKVLQGDGKSLGSVMHWVYVIDAKSDQYLEVKGKLTEADDEKRTLTYTAVEGDLLKTYKSFAARVSVTPKSKESSIVKWSIIYEKLNEDDPNPLPYCDIFAGITSKYDAHFHNNHQVIN